MKRAGGGFDYRYNAQTAVDEAHHIIVATEVVNTSSDVQQLPMALAAVRAHTESDAAQVLADAGYRSEVVMAKLAQALPDTELVIALGREGKAQAKLTDAQVYPHTVALQAKVQTVKGKEDYRKRKWIAEPPNGWIKNVLGFRQFSMRGLKKAQAEFKLVCGTSVRFVRKPTTSSFWQVNLLERGVVGVIVLAPTGWTHLSRRYCADWICVLISCRFKPVWCGRALSCCVGN